MTFNRDNLEEELNKQRERLDAEINGNLKTLLQLFLYGLPGTIALIYTVGSLRFDPDYLPYIIGFGPLVLLACLILATDSGINRWIVRVSLFIGIAALVYNIDLFNQTKQLYNSGCKGCLESFLIIAGVALVLILMTIVLFFLNVLRSPLRRRKTIRTTSKNIDQLESCINNNQDYVIYLSDFNRGDVSISMKTFPVGGTSGEFEIKGNQVFANITKKLNRHIPVFYLGNAREKGPSYAGYPILASDSDWYNYFTATYDHARYAILEYPGSNISKNILLEIDHIVNTPVKSLFYVGRQEEMNLLISQFPVLGERIKGRFNVNRRGSMAHYATSYWQTYSELSETAQGENRALLKRIIGREV